MLILSTYGVVLHPSYLHKVFSFIIFYKRKIQLYDSLWKQPSSWRRVVGGAKEWSVSLTVCGSESWPGSLIASFSIKRCVNPASNWALFIKRSSTNTLEKLCCWPGKTNCIHCSSNEAEQGYLSLTTKNTLLQRHSSRASPVPCSQVKRVDGRALALVDACRLLYANWLITMLNTKQISHRDAENTKMSRWIESHKTYVRF